MVAMPPSSELARLRSVLQKYKVLEHLETVTALMRPGMELIASGQAAGVGCSRFGGEPDLPEGLNWPSVDRKALTFLAQVNLRDVHDAFTRSGWVVPENACDPQGLLPSGGLLQFFCMWDWNESSPSEGGARVFYHGPDESLRRAHAPTGGDAPEHSLSEARMQFEPHWDFPSQDEWDSLPDAERKNDETWMCVWEDMESNRGMEKGSHRLLGHAQEIQGNQQRYCAQMALLEDMGVPRKEKSILKNVGTVLQTWFGKPKAPTIPPDVLSAEQRNWRLLFQLDSDGTIKSEWGDAGMHYFWMRESDMRSRRFEKSCWIAQCY